MSSDPTTRLRVDVALEYDFPAPASVLFAIEALDGQCQRVGQEALVVDGALLPSAADVHDLARYRWHEAGAGRLSLRYRAEVEVTRPRHALADLPATPLSALPAEVAPFLLASRYCTPQRFGAAVADLFGIAPGVVADGSTIAAMRDWVREHLSYVQSSDWNTTAEDSFVTREGVCRDYAHLLIAFARAANVPARFVSAYAWQLDPPDFHAVAEVYLDGAWRLIDATGMAPEDTLIRIAHTRDAIDASFMTIFGSAEMIDQRVSVTAIN